MVKLNNHSGTHRTKLKSEEEKKEMINLFFNCANNRDAHQTSFMSIYENGKVLEYYRYCFGDWYYFKGKLAEETPCTNFVVHLSSAININDNRLRFISWLVNDSIWKDAYITRDPEHIILKGCELDVNLPVQFVMQAAILTRYIRYPGDHRIDTWCMMVDRGIHPIIALWFTHWYSNYAKHYIIPYNNTDAHDMMHTYTYSVNKQQIQRMLDNNRELFSKCDKFSVANGIYAPLNKCWTTELLIYDYNGRSNPVRNAIEDLPRGQNIVGRVSSAFKDPLELYTKFISDNNLVIPD